MTRLNFLKMIATTVVLACSPLSFGVEADSAVTQQITMLDINNADAAAIASALDGVGLSKARDIVAYRELFGSFHSVDELAEVKGIGAVTVEKNRQKIIIVNE